MPEPIQDQPADENEEPCIICGVFTKHRGFLFVQDGRYVQGKPLCDKCQERVTDTLIELVQKEWGIDTNLYKGW